jgi:hypothetical protein
LQATDHVLHQQERTGAHGVDNVDAIEPAIRDLKARRYDVDEISAGPLTSGHTSRDLGVVIKRADGTVVLEPDLWPEA